MSAESNTPEDYSWPMLVDNGLSMEAQIKSNPFRIRPLQLPAPLVDYLLLLADRLKLHACTWQLGFALSARFLRRRPTALPLQLVTLSCMYIACKMLETDPPELNEFHRFSSNSFTSRDFYRTEQTILNELGYDLLSDGLPAVQIELVAESVSRLLEGETSRLLMSVCLDLQRVAWSYIYTGRLKLREGRDRALPAGLVHLALILLTQFSGRFLQTLWACVLTGASEKKAGNLANRMLRELLGEEKCKLYQL